MGCSSSKSVPQYPGLAGSFAEIFFDGRPMAEKKDEVAALMHDDFKLAFVGPFAGATTGMILPKEKVLGMAIPNLVGSMPDFTFNATKVKPKFVDGGWAADIVVKGTHTGAPFSAMPGKLPNVEVKEPPAAWTIGPEEFKVWQDDEGKGLKLEIKCLHEGSLVGPPGIYVAVGGQLPSPPPEMAVLRGFCTGFRSKKTAEFAAEGCMFNPPGAPPMPIEAFLGMVDPMNAAWESWDSRFLGAEKQEDGTWKVKTQQAIGKMVADFKPGGPLPDLPVSKVPESWKTIGCTFPVEVGTYTMSEDGTKVLKATYDGTFDASYSGGSQETSPEVAAVWNKKGDQSDTGFGCMYGLAGVEMPAPPA